MTRAFHTALCVLHSCTRIQCQSRRRNNNGTIYLNGVVGAQLMLPPVRDASLHFFLRPLRPYLKGVIHLPVSLLWCMDTSCSMARPACSTPPPPPPPPPVCVSPHTRSVSSNEVVSSRCTLGRQDKGHVG